MRGRQPTPAPPLPLAMAGAKAAEPRLLRIFNAQVAKAALRHGSVRLCSPPAGQAKSAEGQVGPRKPSRPAEAWVGK